MKKTLAALLSALILLSVCGCSSSAPTSSRESAASDSGSIPVSSVNTQPAESGPRTVTDMQGRSVSISGPVKRVVVNQWDIAEVVMTVVGEDFLDMFVGVGRSGSSDTFQRIYGENYPQLKDMPIVGGGGKASYDVEKILSLKPDVFIINSSGSFLESAMEAVNKLEQAGIPTVILSMSEDPMSSPQQGIRVLGELFGCEQRAQEINGFIDTQFERILSKKLSERQDKPAVYQEKGSGTAEEYDVTSTTDGWASIVKVAGGDNIAVGSIGSSGKIDPEYLLKRDPDYIFITGALGYSTPEEAAQKIDGTIGQYIKRAGWDQLTAVKESRVHMLFHDHSRNQFAFYPVLYMAKLFYPDEYVDLDPDAVLKEFFDRFMLLSYDDGVWSGHPEKLANG